MKIKTEPAEVWAEYEKAQNYNTAIDLYETVKKNENFYVGKQWEGINAPDLEKPTLNFLKRVVSYFLSMIISDDVAANLTSFGSDAGADVVCKILAGEIDRVIERTSAKSLHRDLLRDAAVDGDGSFYLHFDPDLETGQDAKGEICIECVDNTRLLFGNPYRWEVEEQPYLLIVQRKTLETAKEEAQKAGIDPELIKSDNDQSLYGEDKEADSNLVTVLIKMYKEKGTVHFLRCTRGVTLKKPTDTGYKLYPVAYMSWDKIKNSYHGQAAITGLIPNQIFVNKLWAMAMEHVKKSAFPKMFFDRTKIKEWTNKVGQAIGVVGNPNEAVLSSQRGGEMSAQVLELVDRTISYTRDFMGASDAALGNVKPDNTSAIIATQKASAAPLELQRLAFYQFVEDYVRIILDMIRVNYGTRMVKASLPLLDPMTGQETEAEQVIPFDFKAVNYDALQLKVDVGQSTYWSELMQIQTMDNLFSKGIITDVVDYLEGIPDQYIRNKRKLIDTIKERQQMGGMMNGVPGMQGGSADQAILQAGHGGY